MRTPILYIRGTDAFCFRDRCLGNLLVVFAGVQMALVVSVYFYCVAFCCAEGIDCIVNDAVVDLPIQIFTKNSHRYVDWEPIVMESLDDGNIAWIEFCDLFSHSLRR